MKQEDFIVGKWYFSSKWNNFKCAKFKGFIGGCFSYSEHISKHTNKYFSKSGTTDTDEQEWSTFREISLNQIQEFLPEYHPDLLLTKNEDYSYLIPILEKYNIT